MFYGDKALHARDLPTSPPPGVALYCPKHGDSFSASQGDYWADPNEVMTCSQDPRTLLELRRKETTWLPWSAQLATSTPNGFDPHWLPCINTALMERETSIQITDLNDELWDDYLGPMLDAIEDGDITDLPT